VTAEGPGSCHIKVVANIDGIDYPLNAQVDVTDEASGANGLPITDSVDMDKAHLTKTSVTIYTLSDYVLYEVPIVYETKPTADSLGVPGLSAFADQTDVMASYEVSARSAEQDKSTRAKREEDINKYFDFGMKDDRTIEVKRKTGSNLDFTKAQSSYKIKISIAVMAPGGNVLHRVTVPETLTLKMNKTKPAVKAGTHKFNTFVYNQVLPISFSSTRGKIANVKLDTSKKAMQPTWIMVDDPADITTFTLLSDTYGAIGTPPASGKIYLKVTVDGYKPTDYELTVKAARTPPGLKLSSGTAAFMSDAGQAVSLSQGVAMALKPKKVRDSLSGLGVESLGLTDDVYEIKSGSFDPASGAFVLAVKSGAVPVAKKLELRVGITGSTQVVKLSLKTTVLSAGKVPTIKATPGKVTLSKALADGIDVARVKLRPTPADLDLSSLARGAGAVTVKRDGKNVTAAAELDIVAAPDGRSLEVRTTGATKAGKTYMVTVLTAEKYGAAGKQKHARAVFTVKTPTAAKSGVTASIAVKGKLKISKPYETVTLTPKLTNHNGSVSAGDFKISVTSGVGKRKTVVPDTDGWFRISDNGDGSFSLGFVKEQWMKGIIKPEYKYSVSLEKGLPISGGVLSKAATKAFTVGMGKTTFTRNVSSVKLYKANPHSSAIVTISVNKAALPENAKVTVNNIQKSSYDVLSLGNGKYAIYFKGYDTNKVKSKTIRLNVYLEGNYIPDAASPGGFSSLGAKPSGYVTVKVNVK
jgi:hypothetical protein